MNLPRTLVLAALLLNTGCAAKSAVRGMDSRLDVPTLGVDDFEELGVVEFKSPIPVHAVCPAGFEKVDVHQSFWNDFFRLISVGLYRPAKTMVTCRSGASYMIGLNHQGLVEVLKQVKHAAEEGMAALPGAGQKSN